MSLEASKRAMLARMGRARPPLRRPRWASRSMCSVSATSSSSISAHLRCGGRRPVDEGPPPGLHGRRLGGGRGYRPRLPD